jgi:hypothetical protein
MYNNSQSCVPAPICAVCHQPVPLSDAKADEDGHAIHEECYLVKLGMSKPPVGSGALNPNQDLFAKYRRKQTLGN